MFESPSVIANMKIPAMLNSLPSRFQVRGGDMSANNLWLLCSLVETLHHHIGWLKGKQLLLPAAVYTVLRILPDALTIKRNGSGAQGDGSAAASALLAKGVPFCSDLLREYTSDCQVRRVSMFKTILVKKTHNFQTIMHGRFEPRYLHDSIQLRLESS